MRRHIIADKPGSFRAPEGFIAQLRTQTHNPLLDVWWEPHVERYVQRDDSVMEDEEARGCWVVWMKITTPEVYEVENPVPDAPPTMTLWVGHDIYVDVYRLDGMYGRPLQLGQWVIESMNEADELKNPKRRMDLNALNEQMVLRDHRGRVMRSREMARDRLFKWAMAAFREGRGMGSSTATREDRLALERAAVRKAERWERQAKADARQMRVYG